MKIQKIDLIPCQFLLAKDKIRLLALIKITDVEGRCGWGEIAPLPRWSKETLENAQKSINERREQILKANWTLQTLHEQIEKLNLTPSASFALESAILAIISPLADFKVQTSALLMGSPSEILKQAEQRIFEGYKSAKLKVSNLQFDEAFDVIDQIKDKLRLRIDVNRAWETKESVSFFSQFPLDAFDYVEEPFQNPHDLSMFTHSLAVDESFPDNLSLAELESLPNLKALIYKPTIQGGMTGCMILQKWAARRGIEMVLSSSFESDLGLAHIAAMAHRLSLKAPIGIGTYYFQNEYVLKLPLEFFGDKVSVPAQIRPKEAFASLSIDS